MTAPTPISPPILPANNAAPSDGPVSPVSRTSTFPHKTSPAVATQTRLIDTATPAINSVPVELDGMATSAGDLQRRQTGESGVGGGGGGSGVISPADEEDIDAEFLGEGGNAGREAREKRAAILASRSKDPSVIVDVPQYPTAEEVEAAKSAEGMITPGLHSPGMASRSLGGAR
ncbi:uncharacterized protein K460DRAFT_134078 [Cucurbitaria berberidis CBS 394.84]|uniref:Uncharacterized protein n=1 Tax=Cucurbitaria berberidis CBS 394.84 TaxID=1168544 RepID=A0A9P4GC11_9PLEO|nr:uncharacterized protein K460DRAFT_134078 [Cucurbitaria berberidis CBS 394.84]KAF1842744.1 hypothetical protein K460DRAFT_134078 [Cucurbitaria berberidis CBS 394.84]